MSEEDLVTRLRKRAEIRRQITSRKSVAEGKPDRIADLLEEAANEIEVLHRLEVTMTGWLSQPGWAEENAGFAEALDLIKHYRKMEEV